MAKLSAGAESALSVIAHMAMANQLGKNVPGMADFPEFYKKQMSRQDRDVIDQFDRLCKQAYRDLAKMLKQDLAKDG
ncbi:hypothetical protein SKTS_13500 [Sulfurimicrobium lacus]|uniref:Uncharacterized protein n=1 Tax=Sulfurimicrobium lacus TaxID=2715678 RepID=A0A6F8V9X7_9PROT|nr:hypothetical protein [Sulfurimicrobium lacus]BCB26464.1 hypothetical protein SKTS_13500 [Sulfurimicrobium lacus]